ncbi:VOC family protein [Microlunatus parietis]|uniref:Putative glyoxalase superfamily protein PhnB n=1 Tax=Microlunatus parietis TaxID=682979 RepID=A0A7Y9I582_9ACTN|nr:VOC family protein [Microlunatus parietis]NYE70541.1 putative glyoxalase superfamily protein PhnB [Microlunatus parietis]
MSDPDILRPLHRGEAAGVAPEGTGFRGISLHFPTDSRDAVDEAMRTAEATGATLVKPAAAAEWGGHFGYFRDPDGYLLKFVTAS